MGLGNRNTRRLRREAATVLAMIRLYCKKQHAGGSGLCADCQGLWDYAQKRVDLCPFGQDKPTCVQCTVHCYKPAMREKIRVVMRFSGPRMPLRHPILSVFHFIDGRRKTPEALKKTSSSKSPVGPEEPRP